MPLERVYYFPPPPAIIYPSDLLTVSVDDELDGHGPVYPSRRSRDVINEALESSEMDEFSAQARQIRKHARNVVEQISDPSRKYYTPRLTYSSRTSEALPVPRVTVSSWYPSKWEDDVNVYEGLMEYRDRQIRARSCEPCGCGMSQASFLSPIDRPLRLAHSRRAKSYVFHGPEDARLKTNSWDRVLYETNRKSYVDPPLYQPIDQTGIQEGILRDTSSVRHNINMLAHYKGMRHAAAVDLGIRKPKLIMP